ncbi:YwiC-like family protein [Mucilaginibacter endophyticus]|uniref:YwiC-like family protein n=1 Tax=Mucilaginibacter endophyticus TaxID=2675003 RepID=UPI000E0D366F|nr:YwiC-like family protein [Mucilaginibacter endophyticus]
MKVYSGLLLKKEFTISASMIEIEDKLAIYDREEFIIKKIGHHEYKFLSNLSFGTLVSKYGGGVEGIKIYTSLNSKNENLVDITIKTKIRVELILFALLTLVFGLSMIFGQQPLPTWAIILLPLVLIFFWFTYRFQEKNLIAKVEIYLLSFQ